MKIIEEIVLHINYQKTKVINLLFLCFLFYSFYGVPNGFLATPHKFELYFYPVGSPKDIRYSVIVNEDSIFSNIYKYKSILKKRRLNVRELTNLNAYSSSIEPVRNKINSKVEDSWAVCLFIDNILVYQDEEFSFESPPKEIKNLIKYLVKICGINIKLHSFS